MLLCGAGAVPAGGAAGGAVVAGVVVAGWGAGWGAAGGSGVVGGGVATVGTTTGGGPVPLATGVVGDAVAPAPHPPAVTTTETLRTATAQARRVPRRFDVILRVLPQPFLVRT